MTQTLTDGAKAKGRSNALAARQARARIKRSVKSGRIGGQDVLRMASSDTTTGKALARMTIGELLLSLPGIGEATADRVLIDAGISGNRRLNALGERQLEALAEVLR